MINLDKHTIKRGQLISVSNLSVNDYNPNRVSERVETAILESLQDYGQVSDILVRPDPQKKGKYIIIDGEHRYKTLPPDTKIYCTIN